MADHIEYAKTARALMAKYEKQIKESKKSQLTPSFVTDPAMDRLRMQQGFLMEKATQYAQAETEKLPEKEQDNAMKEVYKILDSPTYDPERCGPLQERLDSELGRALDRESVAATQPKGKGLSQASIQPSPAETSRASRFVEGLRGYQEGQKDQNQPEQGKEQPGTLSSRFAGSLHGVRNASPTQETPAQNRNPPKPPPDKDDR